MRIRSPRWMYPLIGLILGVGAPVGAFALRYYSIPAVRLNPAGELATHRFFYLYELLGTCFAFGAAGVAAGWHAERLRRAEAFYQNLSEHDPLTGLYNERAFRDRRCVARNRRYRFARGRIQLLRHPAKQRPHTSMIITRPGVVRNATAQRPTDRLVDTTYIDHAVQKLGPFEPANKESKLSGCR